MGDFSSFISEPWGVPECCCKHRGREGGRKEKVAEQTQQLSLVAESKWKTAESHVAVEEG